MPKQRRYVKGYMKKDGTIVREHIKNVNISQQEQRRIEKEQEPDDLGLDGWQKKARAELEKEEDIKFTNADDDGEVLRLSTSSQYGPEYEVYEDYDTAEQAAIDRVTEDLENEPEIFTSSWLENYIEISDAETIAQEDAESYVNDIEDERVLEEAGGSFQEEYDDLQEQIDEEEEKDEPDDAKVSAWESEQEDVIQRARDDYIESMASDKQDEIENDPVGWLKEMGYDLSNLPSFASINVEDAAVDAVSTDGVGHFMSSYDGNEIELPSGAVAFRVN